MLEQEISHSGTLAHLHFVVPHPPPLHHRPTSPTLTKQQHTRLLALRQNRLQEEAALANTGRHILTVIVLLDCPESRRRKAILWQKGRAVRCSQYP